jgi:hypothetical protein
MKKMFKMKLFLVACLCVGIVGCGLFDDDVIDSGVDVIPLGFVNDTTAIIFNRYWEQIEQHCGGNFGRCDRTDYTGSEMQLADIRFDKVYWTKKIVPDNQGMIFIDSTLFFFNHTYNFDNGYFNQIAVNKLGDKEFQQANKIELKLKNIELIGEGWKFSEKKIVRPWHSGLILANSTYYSDGSNGKHYALINTVAGTFERFTPTDEYEWMNECEDVKWSSVGGLCLKRISDATGFVLLKNGMDTLAVRYDDEDKVNNLFFSGNGINLNGIVYLMDNQGQVSETYLK